MEDLSLAVLFNKVIAVGLARRELTYIKKGGLIHKDWGDTFDFTGWKDNELEPPNVDKNALVNQGNHQEVVLKGLCKIEMGLGFQTIPAIKIFATRKLPALHQTCPDPFEVFSSGCEWHLTEVRYCESPGKLNPVLKIEVDAK